MTYGAVEITYEMVPAIIQDDKSKDFELKTLTKAQLIEAIIWIMEDIIEHKCQNFISESEIPNKTMFHARTLPSISLKDYLTRFSHYSKCEEDTLIYAMIYLDRIGELVNGFNFDSFNIHKLLLMSMSIACKFCDDNYFTNTYYANTGGIPVEEFNNLEQEYLVNYIQFNLYVKLDLYNMYYSDIVRYYQDKLIQKGSLLH